MDLSVLGDIADVIAALAIILSLVFVGYELHQNRTQAELSNWREILQTLVDYKGLTNDPEFAEFVTRAHADYGDLSEAERLRFGMYLEQGVHIIGNFLKHNQALPKKLEGLEAAVASMFIDMLTTPGGAAWWAESRSRGRFMPATYRTVDDILEKGRPPAR
ncbi:hypothetical protein P6F26_07205 [Roseibacterium sp. SDUM158017]|uniref:hypothetical protein n=1 Tax=Roseicyclus salinarum TaxID=3036773 RepID=UPI0024154F15|nr:hypothetical protein [Roseibacterium sp. SDUM158017]MDG4648227.1 hypothetical protein [Roseibacterium sp. SDUM158017]